MMMGGQPGMQYPGMTSAQVAQGMTAPFPQGQQQPGQPGQGNQLQPSQVPAMQPGYQQQSSALQQQMQYQHIQQQHQQQLQLFWQQQMGEVEQATDFKNHQLPLARIKKIMKADEDVRMISAEAPVVFSKACEMFILELTLRSWIHTEENKRRTLQKNDIAGAITRTDIFDFLVDIVPRDELKEDGLGIPRAPVAMPTAEVPYAGMYYVPQAASGQAMPQPGMMAPQMMVGRPSMGVDQMYSQQRGPPMQYMQQPMQQQMWGSPQVPPQGGNMPPQNQ